MNVSAFSKLDGGKSYDIKNVYRTPLFLVIQNIVDVCPSLEHSLLVSNEIYIIRNCTFDAWYEKECRKAGVDPDGRRMKVDFYSRQYVYDTDGIIE